MAKEASPEVKEDCLECKVVGVTSFTIAGLYVLHSRQSLPPAMKASRFASAGFGGALLALAVVRAFV
eukprot:m.84538 g.84538  ORF g.84538 m.84538 type:complete len:67 (-) comp25763_c0_seq1:409-609(-)